MNIEKTNGLSRKLDQKIGTENDNQNKKINKREIGLESNRNSSRGIRSRTNRKNKKSKSKKQRNSQSNRENKEGWG